MTEKSSSSCISYIHCNLFQNLGRPRKADHRSDGGDSDSSIEPVKKRRQTAVRQRGETFLSYFFVKKYFLVAASSMLWTGQWMTQ